PHRSGIELTNSLEHRDFFLVYTTAHHEYAVDALRQKAHDYLLKPIDRDDLVACTRRMIMHFYHQRKPGTGS
ncbi:MAG: DNA-binding response regulator, partial [Flavobacteriales bacterium]